MSLMSRWDFQSVLVVFYVSVSVLLRRYLNADEAMTLDLVMTLAFCQTRLQLANSMIYAVPAFNVPDLITGVR